jgi:hypothetical protein
MYSSYDASSVLFVLSSLHCFMNICIQVGTEFFALFHEHLYSSWY